MTSHNARQFIYAGILTGLLAGCASTTAPSISQQDLAIQSQIAGLSDLPVEQRSASTLDLVQQLNALGRYEQSLEVGAQFPIDIADTQRFAAFQLEMALAEFRRGNAQVAVDQITQALTSAEDFLLVTDQAALLDLRARAHEALSDNLSALADWVRVNDLTDNATAVSRIWALAQQLAGQSATVENQTAAGWIALAETQTQENIPAAIREWHLNWPAHPALGNLPLELADYFNTDWPTATRVGLILPLSGALSQVGETILDGVMSEQLGSPGPVMVLIDGSQGVEAALAELRSQNVDLIVGPLPKDQVDALMALNPVEPVLALNYVDGNLEDALAPRALMGLAPEDGARDAATLISSQYEQAPLVLTPATPIGERVATAFSEAWQTLNGETPISRSYLNDNQREVVSEALGITASQERHRNLERSLGLDLEFTPRRRQDIGSVYIYGDSITAAQLKPLIAFYFGGDLPIWLSDSTLDQNLELVRGDLQGAYVVAMPWQLDQTSPSSVLFELGADAWMLTSALTDKTAEFIPGRTGTWFRSGNDLRRELVPARIQSKGFDIISRPTDEPQAENVSLSR